MHLDLHLRVTERERKIECGGESEFGGMSECVGKTE